MTSPRLWRIIGEAAEEPVFEFHDLSDRPTDRAFEMVLGPVLPQQALPGQQQQQQAIQKHDHGDCICGAPPPIQVRTEG